jgi:hypothetical protein
MGMHQINDHLDVSLVGFIDELFELVGSAESTGDTEVTAHMVAEGTVVRVLENSHQLDYVVSVFLY